ncbi:exocyst complex subunit Sec15-like-domain-containing protein [Parachaetomium inaequale]|uniref:Exocyst complex component SEC15 n=1 Tax=Parachaetomium inaequale TaxID=2588326 RepID=A0AAN6SRI4_9PEZI|nr:exocyst complex subunit Sec15-like-domain-containing protein [Parachaetomium inaequale]
MPRKAQTWDDYDSAVTQTILAPSDSEFLDQLIPVLKDATTSSRIGSLVQSLSQYAEEREGDIERIGLTKHEEFLGSVNQLQKVREGTVALTSEILDLNQSIQASTEKLAEQKQGLVNTRGVRQNITEVSAALEESLKILHAVNNAHDLIRKKKYYAALKSLEDLQNEYLVPIIQNKFATQYKLADMIQKSIPASQKTISELVMSDLNTWLFIVRESSQFLGEVAFYHTQERRARQRERMEGNELLSRFKLNSAIELVFDENDEFDVLYNDELQVDFTPLHEALHIHEALGQVDRFRVEYAATRRQQKDLIMPSSENLFSNDDDEALKGLLESVAGFAIIEKATMQRAPLVRSTLDLWDSMCQATIRITSRSLEGVTNADLLLNIKDDIALFIQTMEGWGYSASLVNNFQLVLFHKYAALLQRRFGEVFQEIVSTDDYMPMNIKMPEEYDDVYSAILFDDEMPPDQVTLPTVLPFSKMYPHCCNRIREFEHQFRKFTRENFDHPNIVDETLRKTLDELLTDIVCQTLVERLNSQYLGQIVQILTNLEHFELACQKLERLLISGRSSTSAGGPVTLKATELFRNHKKTAEKRIFELVNSKIDDLVDTSDYDWTATTTPKQHSSYMGTLTRFLESIMNSTLLGLPREIKELIYFDALSHAANKILALPLSPDVKKINPNGVAAMALDVAHLTDFVSKLDNAFMLEQNLDELQQTVALMQCENHEEFYDISIRNKKYGRVDAMNGPLLLEKITQTVENPSRTAPLANFGSRFGLR